MTKTLALGRYKGRFGEQPRREEKRIEVVGSQNIADIRERYRVLVKKDYDIFQDSEAGPKFYHDSLAILRGIDVKPDDVKAFSLSLLEDETLGIAI